MHRIWIGLNGTALCDNHLGFYAKSILEKDNMIDEIFTPIDHYIPFYSETIDMCETCTFNSPKESE